MRPRYCCAPQSLEQLDIIRKSTMYRCVVSGISHYCHDSYYRHPFRILHSRREYLFFGHPQISTKSTWTKKNCVERTRKKRRRTRRTRRMRYQGRRKSAPNFRGSSTTSSAGVKLRHKGNSASQGRGNCILYCTNSISIAPQSDGAVHPNLRHGSISSSTSPRTGRV